MQDAAAVDGWPIRRILVGTDFSDGARAALEWAIDLALRHDAEVELVHAICAAPLSSVPLQIQAEADRRLGRDLDVVRRADVPASGRCCVGRSWEVIAEAERERGADLVVVGTRGQTPHARLLLGSTADRVIRIAVGPVVTVPPGFTGRPSAMRTALVPTDFSEEADLAVGAALHLLRAGAAGGRLVLLHACDLPLDYGIASGANVIAAARADDETHARAQLDRLAETVRRTGVQVDTVVRQGYAAGVAEEEAERRRADLIAVGTHGRSGLMHLLLGSVAERILHHAPCPVLTMRAAHGAVTGATESAAHAWRS